jgi:TubC N-terminal docking domain
MTTSSFLAELWQRGVVLRLSDDRSRILVRRSQINPELRARLAQDKPEILKLLAYVDEYRALLRNAFAIMVQSEATHSGLHVFADDQARLTDEMGASLTQAIRDGEARQWLRETGLCPVCGEEQSCDMCEEMGE